MYSCVLFFPQNFIWKQLRIILPVENLEDFQCNENEISEGKCKFVVYAYFYQMEIKPIYL